MKNIIKKISLFLMCALCVISFACCFSSDPTDGSDLPNSESDYVQESNESQGNNESQENNESQGSDGGQESDSSDLSGESQGDENELPRVPYGA